MTKMWIEVVRMLGEDRRDYHNHVPEWKVAIKTINGKRLLISRAWSPRKIDAMRIAKKVSEATGLEIRV